MIIITMEILTPHIYNNINNSKIPKITITPSIIMIIIIYTLTMTVIVYVFFLISELLVLCLDRLLAVLFGRLNTVDTGPASVALIATEK